MRLGRRAVLAGIGLGTLPGGARGEDAPHGRVRLRPAGDAVGFVLAPAGEDARLEVAGETGVTLPGRPVAVRVLPIARRQVVECRTALPDGEVLASLVGADVDGVRVLAVECAERREAGRRWLAMRMEAVPDDRRLLLRFQAVDGARREDWTDALAWGGEGAMRSEPLRPVLAGTMQARMAAVRGRVLALLEERRREVTLGMLQPTGVLDPLGWG